jgi:CDGSH-type Zn-finger protein
MSDNEERIEVRPDGPYLVSGSVPLVRKSEIVSEHGEPIAWQKGDEITRDEKYALCRCGHSENKPFCDGTHSSVGFDGTETADTEMSAARRRDYEGHGVVMSDDKPLCVHAGFCGNRETHVWDMIDETEDTEVRSHLMAMVERCPSGRLSYRVEPDGEDVEPDLPKQIATVPDGPLWATGGIEIDRADGAPIETRNRVTLCRCGASGNKPLCDGSHKEAGFEAE